MIKSGRGLISPGGLLLALLCFALPFITVSCESPIVSVSADYTGWDFVFGGQPHVTTTGPGGEVAAQQRDASIPWQPLALFTVLIIVGGMVLSLLRPRLRRVVGIITGGVAALFLAVNQSTARAAIVSGVKKSNYLPSGTIDKMVESRVGFWVTLVLLLAVAAYNAVELALHRRAQTPP